MFPGIAVAEEFIKRNPSNKVIFIGTERGIEKRVLGLLGYTLRMLDVEGVKGRGLMKAAAAVIKIPKSMIQSRSIFREFKPDVVVGVGGYASGPSVITAWLMGIKTAVAEQNVIPGVTNRILARFVDKIFVAFSETTKWVPEKKTIVSGNPIRAAFLVEKKTATAASDGSFSVLIFGGSQGAHAVNKACVEALDSLASAKDRLNFVHQTGDKDLGFVSEAYRAKGFRADVRPFIIDMPEAYRAADLIVCRAGATSIAELTACGKAAVLIPFPYAIHDHQTKNAEVLVNAGAAEMIVEKDLTGKSLAEIIVKLMDRPDTIWVMEKKSLKLGNKRAAADIVDACLQLIQAKPGEKRKE